MKIFFFFWDGVGLGSNNPVSNPFITANTPALDSLLEGSKIHRESSNYFSESCSFIGIDAQLGVSGLPQSATGQATLLTGVNFSKSLGKHYGPKPNPEIVSLIQDLSHFSNPNMPGTLFSHMTHVGKTVALINAYPQVYFNSINSRRRNHSVIPLTAINAGVTLLGEEDLINGSALSADFTGQGWHDHLQLFEIPIISPKQAGERLGKLIQKNDLTFFEYWEPDLAGHKQNMDYARNIIEKLDKVLEGILETLDWEDNLVLITSDHGNMEDLSSRRHTNNHVPAILIGRSQYHLPFQKEVQSIQDITPFLKKVLNDDLPHST